MRLSAAAVAFLLAPLIVHAQTTPSAQSTTPAPTQTTPHPPRLHIRILNAKTKKPVTDEQLNIWLRADQIGATLARTDKNGDIFLDPGPATTIRVLANFYADCRPRAELYTDYSISTIRSGGILGGSNCPHVDTAPTKPGDLILFVFPKTYIPTMGQPPNTNLPHSDEQVPH